MKESYWGYLVIIFGVLSIALIYLFQTITNINEHNYTLLKETTEAAMIDALDLASYRQNGIVRIDQEKFVENFVRRFANNAQLSKDYLIEIYDVNEEPPKVSIKISSSEGTGITGELLTFDIQNKLDAILEEPHNRPYQTGSKPTEPLLPTDVLSRIETGQTTNIYESGEFGYVRDSNLGLSSYSGIVNQGTTKTIDITGDCLGELSCLSGNKNVATCEISGNQLIIRANNLGTANIQVKTLGNKCDGLEYSSNIVNYDLNVIKAVQSSVVLSETSGTVNSTKTIGLSINNCAGNVTVSSTNPSISNNTLVNGNTGLMIEPKNDGTNSIVVRCQEATKDGILYLGSTATYTATVKKTSCPLGSYEMYNESYGGDICYIGYYTRETQGSCLEYSCSGYSAFETYGSIGDISGRDSSGYGYTECSKGVSSDLNASWATHTCTRYVCNSPSCVRYDSPSNENYCPLGWRDSGSFCYIKAN